MKRPLCPSVIGPLWQILNTGLPEKNVEKLHYALNLKMNISELDDGKLDQDSEKEWWAFLNINVSKGTGNLKINIPDVPG